MAHEDIDLETFLTAARLTAICPSADPEIIETILTDAPKAFPIAGLTTRVTIAHFIGQIAAETLGLGRLDENLDYSTPQRLINVFGRAKFPDAEFARGYLHSPKKLANYVYAGRNGNTLPDDGYTYRGSGLIQLTGRGNFRKVGRLVGMPLEEQPELVRAPDSALAIALAYWRLNDISSVATNTSDEAIEAVTKRINPALQGLADRRTYVKRAFRVLAPPRPMSARLERAAAGLATLLKYAEGQAATEAAVPASLSGAHWVAFFPTSRSIDDLAEPFRSNVTAFVKALRNAGADLSVSATFRPEERAYLMHFAWRIAREDLDPAEVPAKPSVPITWRHPTPAKSRAAARDMVNGYSIAFKPSLTSRHTAALAIDMTISWSGTLSIRQQDGTTLAIDTTPRNGSNSRLIAVGHGYDVIKLLNDPPHWSDNGH